MGLFEHLNILWHGAYLNLSVCVFVCVFLHLQELCIDLELRNWPALLSGSLSAVLDASKQVVDGPGDDTQLVLSTIDVEAGSHGVGLPRTRLDKRPKTELESIRVYFVCFINH